jgi:lysophospholipase L1-like esterase
VIARGVRAAGAWLGYAAWLLVAALVVDYGLYRLRIRPAAPARDPLAGWDALDPALRSRVGFLGDRARRASSFGNFPEKKPPGVTRIGCFGDSVTWGSEVDDGLDWPGQLQERLRHRGRGDVEVLNFGNGSHGFHQSYLLWEALARRYELDRVLFAPQDFWPRRDTTFANPFIDTRVLHARYVLRDGGLALVEPVGDDPADRARQFDRFVPPWRYLRYDRTAPAFLRALLPPGRTLANPFYYDGRDAEEEAFAIYAQLLARMAAGDPPVTVLLEPGSRFAELVAPLDVGVVRLASGEGFPLRAPGGHPSPWGQRAIAEQVLAALQGTPDGRPPRIELADLAPGEAVPDAAGQALARPGAEMAVHLGALRVGGVYHRDPRRSAADRVPAFAADRESVLAVRAGGRTLADAIVFALRGSPPALALRLPDGRHASVSPTRLAEGSSLWVVDLAAAARDEASLPATASTGARIAAAHEPGDGARELVLLANRHALARAFFEPAEDGLVVVPQARHYRIAADGGVRPELERLPERGFVHWVIARSDGTAEVVRLAAWRRREAGGFDGHAGAD